MKDKNSSTEQAVRIRHYQGQRLLASDLQDEYDNLAWLRGLHIVGLHDTWGIASGFDVTVDSVNWQVQVQPGLAYDAYGREILLAQPHALSLPDPQAAPGTSFDLVARYNTELRQAADVDVALCPRLIGERPSFLWQRSDQTRPGRDVLLLTYTFGAYTDQIDLDGRRYTQTMARPRVGSGITPANQPWTIGSGSGVAFCRTYIDTSNAGFIGTPAYIATPRFDSTAAFELLFEIFQLRGLDSDPSRRQVEIVDFLAFLLLYWFDLQITEGHSTIRSFASIAYPPAQRDGTRIQSSDATAVRPLLVDPPGPAGFTYEVLIDTGSSESVDVASNQTLQAPIPFLGVSWLGVERSDMTPS
jgi:hypothetical protein